MNLCCLRYERFGHEQCRVPTPTATIPSGKGETHEKRGRLRVDLGVVVVSSLTRSLVARRASVSAVCHVDTACTVFVAVFVVRRASIRRCGGGSYVVFTSNIDCWQRRASTPSTCRRCRRRCRAACVVRFSLFFSHTRRASRTQQQQQQQQQPPPPLCVPSGCGARRARRRRATTSDG